MKKIIIVAISILAWACSNSHEPKFYQALPFDGNLGSIESIDQMHHRAVMADSVGQKGEVSSSYNWAFDSKGKIVSTTVFYSELPEWQFNSRFEFNKEGDIAKEYIHNKRLDNGQSKQYEKVYFYVDQEKAYTMILENGAWKDSTLLFFDHNEQIVRSISHPGEEYMESTVQLFYEQRRVVEQKHANDRGRWDNKKVFYDAEKGIPMSEAVSNSNGLQSIVSYKYLEFDKHNNWIAREAYANDSLVAYTTRKITYRE